MEWCFKNQFQLYTLSRSNKRHCAINQKQWATLEWYFFLEEGCRAKQLQSTILSFSALKMNIVCVYRALANSRVYAVTNRGNDLYCEFVLSTHTMN